MAHSDGAAGNKEKHSRDTATKLERDAAENSRLNYKITKSVYKPVRKLLTGVN